MIESDITELNHICQKENMILCISKPSLENANDSICNVFWVKIRQDVQLNKTYCSPFRINSDKFLLRCWTIIHYELSLSVASFD